MSDQQQNIKDIIKQEYIKCATDPVYFMKKYVYALRIGSEFFR